MKLLVTVTAVIEFGAGVGLVLVPSTAVMLLLGAPLETPAALTLARVAGSALLALGLANWLARYDAESSATKGLVTAMVLYNLGAAVFLFSAGIWSQTAGILLWPAVILHTAMTIWCITSLTRTKG